MTTAITVSRSEVNTFRTCRRKWWLRYDQNLDTRTSSEAQNAGKAGHAGAEFALRALQCDNKTPDDELHLEAMRGVLIYFAGEFEHVDPIPRDSDLTAVDNWLRRNLDDDGRSLLSESLQTVARSVDAFVIPDREQFEVLAVEHAFDVPILDDKGTARSAVREYGVIDCVLRNRSNNELIVGEHKFTSGDCSTMDARLDVDPQMPGYVYALEQLLRGGAWRDQFPAGQMEDRRSVGRVFLNCTRRTGPGAARVNKIKRSDVCGGAVCGCKASKHTEDCSRELRKVEAQEDEQGVNLGLVSTASHDTTRGIYFDALREQVARGFDITPAQHDRVEQLPQAIDRWACRHQWFYTAKEVDEWRRDELADARLVRRTRLGILPASRNGYACAPQNALPCAYRTVCVQDTPETRADYGTRQGTRDGVAS